MVPNLVIFCGFFGLFIGPRSNHSSPLLLIFNGNDLCWCGYFTHYLMLMLLVLMILLSVMLMMTLILVRSEMILVLRNMLIAWLSERSRDLKRLCVTNCERCCHSQRGYETWVEVLWLLDTILWTPVPIIWSSVSAKAVNAWVIISFGNVFTLSCIESITDNVVGSTKKFK